MLGSPALAFFVPNFEFKKDHPTQPRFPQFAKLSL